MAAAVKRNRLVTYLLATLGGAAGAVIGWIVTGLVADTLLGLGGMSDREGGRAMVVLPSALTGRWPDSCSVPGLCCASTAAIDASPRSWAAWSWLRRRSPR